MKRYLYIFSSFTVLVGCSCNETTNRTTSISAKVADSTLPPKPAAIEPASDTATRSSPAANPQILTLSANALQLVDAVSGSTKEISFGMPFDQLLALMNRVLNVKEPSSIQVNAECGAGPLKMATWSNGLTLVFAEKQRGNGEWRFAGWFAGKPATNDRKLTTMAGISVGSSRKELEEVYVVTVIKTSLGQEFSVGDGFFGILSGAAKEATIEVMWSGASCNFR